jgi:uncharacterized damage-inducible protein DinB
MSQLARHRRSYEYEEDCNQKMLAMIGSVPEARRSDARFQRAVTLAGHLAACRENWLDRMEGAGQHEAAWFDAACDLASLAPRLAAVQDRWTDYLAHLQESQLAQDFEFFEGDMRFSLPIGVQIEQLAGHALYHRGQIALLVDQLGGETVDTDYADWWWANQGTAL